MVTEAAARLALRPMTTADIETASELSREQGWPHREEDWVLFLELGEGIVAELDGRLAGTIMGWRYGEDMATLGMVIVTNAAQGQGIGRQLMQAMLERLHDRTVVLNATAEGLPLYRKLGFAETGAVYQHQAAAPVVPLAALMPGERVRPMGAADDSLGALYSQAGGMDRSKLFDVLVANGSTVVLTREHQPVGFALFRRFGRGWAIGPVVAPDIGGAKTLISHWLGANKGTFCRLDVTGESGLSPWLEDLGLPCVGTVVTMALGPAPTPEGPARIAGLASQALG
jgi:predicted N-acetyltransferase YhbS